MHTGDVIALIGLAVLGIAQIGGYIFWVATQSGRVRSCEQALNRHDGQFTAVDGRLSRHSERFDKIESANAQRDSIVAAALAKLESRIDAMHASLNRLIDAEAQRLTQSPAASRTLVDQLRDFVEIRALLEKGAVA